MKIEKEIIAVGEILFDCYPNYKVLGGAPFNFIYHIWRLSGKGKLISRIGDDELGNEILDRLNSENFNTDFIQIDKYRKTGRVYIKLNNEKVPEFIIEDNAAYDFISLIKKAKEYITNEAGLIYFGSLAQRNKVSRNTIRKLFNNNSKYFFDINLRQNFYTKKILSNSLLNSDIVKVNEDELKIINNLLLKTDYDLIKISQQLIKEFNIEMLCVTLGEEGAVLITKQKINKHKHVVRNIKDTVGAGDAYSAVLCIGYLLQWDLNKINTIASEFAADICTINGAIPKDKTFYNKYIEVINNEQN